MEPGIYSGAPPEAYFKLPGVSQSSLQWLAHSPAYFKWRKENPEPPTDAMKLGSAVHMAVLEPERFEQRYAVLPEGDGRTKEVREARARAILDNPGKDFLKADDFELCYQISSAVHAHSQASQLIENGQHEQKMLWVDHETGLVCRGIVDSIVSASPMDIIVDVKTTRSALPREFERAAFSGMYYLQAAMYVTGYEEITGSEPRFMWIAVEKEPPFEVVVYEADSLLLEYGKREMRTLLELYKRCLETNHFPAIGWNEGLSTYEVLQLSIPSWAPYLDRMKAGEI
jgi:hypothetical protein